MLSSATAGELCSPPALNSSGMSAGEFSLLLQSAFVVLCGGNQQQVNYLTDGGYCSIKGFIPPLNRSALGYTALLGLISYDSVSLNFLPSWPFQHEKLEILKILPHWYWKCYQAFSQKYQFIPKTVSMLTFCSTNKPVPVTLSLLAN